MFKIGQKVVFVGAIRSDHTNVIPRVGEILTIIDINECGDYLIKNYEYCRGIYSSSNQYFEREELRPLDESFAEGVLRKVVEEVNEEELIEQE